MNTGMARAYWLEGGRLVLGKPEEFFPFMNAGGKVISLVGGGGKTTLMLYLAAQFAERGMKAAATTTTKIGCPQHWCETIEDCRVCWNRGAYAICGEQGKAGKLSFPACFDELLSEADAVIIEADGAHGLPCKAPAAHEPVILPETDIVIAVMGLDALNRPVGEICHRSERVCDLLGCTENHLLSAGDLAAILLSERGSRKDVGNREFFVVLNKCDDLCQLEEGKKILHLFREQGQIQAILTSGMTSGRQDGRRL